MRRKSKWTEAGVISALRSFYGGFVSGGRRRGKPPSLEIANPPLIGGARRVFGSLKAAMEAAGLPYPPQAPSPWTKEAIVEALRRMHAQGKDLSLRGVTDRSNGSLLGPALHRFGSWRAAVEAAGIDYASVARVKEWHAEDVLEGLRDRHRKGLELGGGTLQHEDLRLWAAAKRHFGSYEKARKAAGLPIEPAAPEWSWAASQFRKTIKQLHREGVDLASASIRKTHKDLFYAARSRLGSWERAVESAGVRYDTVRRAREWSEQAVIDRLRELHKSGAELRAGSIQKSDVPLGGAVQRYFGTLRKAMAAAGLPYVDGRSGGPSRPIGHWTESLVLSSLRELHAEGADLRFRSVQTKRQPLFFAAKHFFGSYTRAVSEAGINYWEMSQLHLRRRREQAPPSTAVEEE